MPRDRLGLAAILLIASPLLPAAAAEPSRDDVLQALRRAAGFYREQVAAHGGYVWQYRSDLTWRRGEAVVGPSTIWVQPPGTPTVGAAYLDAYEATGDAFYLDAARETGLALVAGQMRSGGWFYSVEFDPEARQSFAFRDVPPRRKQQARSTLDDDTTPAALRFLMRLDRTLEFQEPRIHEAVTYARKALLGVQYPNGGWYQWWTEFPDKGRPGADEFPVVAASYPESWSRVWLNDWPGRYYTNDNVAANVITTLLQAHETYGDPAALEAACDTGAFLILAQMPDPQPAWAQQYDRAMHPCWDRKFEPPALSGAESQGILDALLLLYRKTGQARFLAPVPRALDYLRRSQLPDGRLARFYELQTNRPLYFTKDYQLTYSSDDVPTHYAFVVDSRLDRIENEYRRLLEASPEQRDPQPGPPRVTSSLTRRVEGLLAGMDERGAWVEPPKDLIESQSFARNVATLCQFLRATTPPSQADSRDP